MNLPATIEQDCISATVNMLSPMYLIWNVASRALKSQEEAMIAITMKFLTDL